MTASPVPLHLSPLLRGPAAEVLALAFHQDPIACYVFPEEARRHRVLRWMFHCHLRYGLRYGEVYTTDGGDGVAIWLSPGQTTQTLWRLLRTGRPPRPLAVWLERLWPKGRAARRSPRDSTAPCGAWLVKRLGGLVHGAAYFPATSRRKLSIACT
jgi:hypothetical protein